MDPFSSAAIARLTWELENNIQEKPCANDPHYFKRVKVSALALLKMVVHARSGGNIEVVGLMQGKTDGNTIIVMDSLALPVEGTETRVNAVADAYEYMIDYSQTNKQVDWRMLLGSTIPVLDVDVGFLALMFPHKCLTRNFRSPS
ncbi:COP9 signalosome complex subunit 5a-like [Olea europaea subsp. europaea]|uniref:COP9 signalosome complex subunit 5 n=1 Tax=Olea europaea subsp. europaea TaxID=158383 RepID=A0A8S0P8Q3_OLEEU|nr:COP9 signalosome complex subunit 5a-like [Olea europaea subsp. europaea]